jgi:predicted TIM-barrel fold metal-dependent hydrolase
LDEIIDVHIHCSELDDDILFAFAKANHLKYNLDELTHLMKTNNVVSGLLLSPPLSSGHPVPNERIIKLCRKTADKLFPVLTVEPSRNKIEECVKLAKEEKGFVKAFKILLGYFEVFPDDKLFSPIFDYAESSDIPVMFHTGDTATSDGSLRHAHPLTLDPLANTRQELKIVVCHFGNPWIMDTAELLYKHKNVFADISGLVAGSSTYSRKYLNFLGQKLSEAVYFIGNTDKILFGTDYPIETYKDALYLTKRIKVQESDRDKILCGNASKVFHFD